MEGICVPHNDDCSALCVPRIPDPAKRRVCSKGCNVMVKTPSHTAGTVAKGASDEATEQALNDIVVCQVDRRIVCQAWSKRGRKKASRCSTNKSVVAIARCSFTSAIWTAGATCITQIAHGEKDPNCPVGTTQSTKKKGIKKKCFALNNKEARAKSQSACQNLATALAEYY